MVSRIRESALAHTVRPVRDVFRDELVESASFVLPFGGLLCPAAQGLR